MRTILCPVDFTPRSDRLLRYITDLAKDRQGKIYLVSTKPLQKKDLEVAGSYRTHTGEDHRLEEWHDYLSGIQHVPCSIVEEELSGSMYKKLGEIADHYDIMAVPVASSADEKVKTKDLVLNKIIGEALAPILAIPDHFSYHKIKRLLYAYDYKNEPEAPLMQLHWLAEWFDTEVLFITLFPGDTSILEQYKLNTIHQAIKTSWQGHHAIKFETIVYPNVPKGLEHYLKLSDENDLLVLSINHQNILERVWHKSVVKGMLQYSKHPYLIIHK